MNYEKPEKHTIMIRRVVSWTETNLPKLLTTYANWYQVMKRKNDMYDAFVT